MKKVRVMLTALTVLSVVGGALAFKAKKFNGNLHCSITKGAACTNAVFTAADEGVRLFCEPLSSTICNTLVTVLQDN